MAGIVEARSRKLAKLIVRSAREPRDRIISNGYRGLLDALADGRTRLRFDAGDWDAHGRARVIGECDVASIVPRGIVIATSTLFILSWPAR